MLSSAERFWRTASLRGGEDRGTQGHQYETGRKHGEEVDAGAGEGWRVGGGARRFFGDDETLL